MTDYERGYADAIKDAYNLARQYDNGKHNKVYPALDVAIKISQLKSGE